MPSATKAETRARIVDNLGMSVLHAMALRESLLAEKSALESQDLAALDTVVQNKSRCVTELQTLDTERTKICAAADFEAGASQMQSLIAWCDEESVISNAWDQLMHVAADCNALNLTNGAIIRVREQQIRSSLSLIRGQAPESDTYGHPDRTSSGFEQRSLAEA